MAAGPTPLPQGPVPGGPALILCALGTHPQPFERALDWVLQASGEEELVVQHGATPARGASDRVRWQRYVPYDQLVELMRAADVVVAHAGVGTLMTAIEAGRVPVAIPRLRSAGEHVDDHQVQIATELGGVGYLVPCMGADALPAAIEAARGGSARVRSQPAELCRAAIVAAGGDPSRRAQPGT